MAESTQGERIAAAAEAVDSRVAYTPYQNGGKDERTGLDCSYFVYLALHAVDPAYQYNSSAAIAASPSFERVSDPRPGDIAYFPPSQVPYQVAHHNDRRRYPGHVAIVTGPNAWVGKQNAPGDGHVAPGNNAYPWWASRPTIYLRYKGAGR